MIFITIGTQEPFDRLIEAVDLIASRYLHERFVAQTFTGKYQPRHLETKGFLDPEEFDALFEQADLIISHAGMGTILTALIKGKPMIIIPRVAALGEHRNEHQLATAKKMQELQYVNVVHEVEDLDRLVEDFLKDRSSIISPEPIGKYASESLTASLSEFIFNYQREKV